MMMMMMMKLLVKVIKMKVLVNGDGESPSIGGILSHSVHCSRHSSILINIQSFPGLEGLGGDSRGGGADLQSLLGNMSQQQLMQILASGGLTFGALPGLLGNSGSSSSRSVLLLLVVVRD